MWRLTKKLALLVAGAMLGLALAEIGLRLLGISHTLPSCADEYAGWRLQPGLSYQYSREGNAPVQINRFGFRDVDHAIQKPAQTLRIAVLGDSYAEAVQVPIEQTFWSLLPKHLQACVSNRDVEVLNFGVSGYGTAQQLQVLRHYVWQFEPDIVLVAFFGGNDIRNNSPKLESERVRPFFELRGEELILDDSFLNHADYQKAQSAWTRWKVACINRCRVLQLINEWKSRVWRPMATDETADGSAELGVDELCFVKPRTDDWREAWNVTERILSEMARECQARQAMFCVATVTSGIQVHPDGKVRSAFQARLGASDLFYAEHRIQQLGARQKFPVIELAPKMREVAESSGRYLHGFANAGWGVGHWNAEGHRMASELMAGGICAARESMSE